MSINCKLCNLPVPSPPISQDSYNFCCYGCLGVFNIFGKDILNKKIIPKKQKKIIPKTGMREFFLRIKGMHCSSCETLIKHYGEKIKGILHISTSYATSSAKVIFDPNIINEAELPKKLSIAGYQAYSYKDKEFIDKIKEDRSLLKVIIATALAGIVMMLNIAFFYPIDLGLVSIEELKPVSFLSFYIVPRVMFVATTLLVFIIGLPILRGALIGIRTRRLNMDNLLTIAILSAYGYSTTELIMGRLDLYFDVSSMIVAVVSVGRYFENKAKNQATQELNNIIQAWSTDKVRISRNGKIKNLNIKEIKANDILIIKQGECIPVNGQIISGEAALDESLITGEPFPVNRTIGDDVLGGVIVIEGDIKIRIGSKIKNQINDLSHIFWDIQSSRVGSTSLADKISRVFVPTVLILAIFITIFMLSNGVQLTNALLAGMTTLIVSCPCTFGLATPLASAMAISSALKNKIIITSRDIFEKAPNFSIIAIDKTGTLSKGKMGVVDIIGGSQIGEYASAVEKLSPHPIAKAIAKLDTKLKATNLIMHPGKGVLADINEKQVAVGSISLFDFLGWNIPTQLTKKNTKYKNNNYAISYVGWDNNVFGAIITQDQKRPEWKQVIAKLRKNKRIIMLTGAQNSDNYEKYIDECYTALPPEAKAAVIQQLKSNEGKVLMIGDGSNDAPALAAANLGIAFGSPTSLSAQAADVIIPGNNLNRILVVLNLIKITRRRIRQNISWALLYNAILIPLALTGQLNPLFAALAMTLSSFLVVWNSSRTIKL